MRKKFMTVLCLSLSCLLLIGPAFARAQSFTGGVRDPRFLLPGELPGQGTTAVPTGTPTGAVDLSKLQPGQTVTGTIGSLPGGVLTMQFPTGAFMIGTTVFYYDPSAMPLAEGKHYAGGVPDPRFNSPDAPTAGAGQNGYAQTGSLPTSIGNAIIGNCEEWVNVRGDPSTANPPICQVFLNETVSIQRYDGTGTWAFCVFEAGTGWIAAKFLIH